jgi:hypothetical protein
MRALLGYRKKPIVLLALVALLTAQAAAGLHALKHFGQPGEPLGLASHHVQLCLECASFAPLNGTHSGSTTAVTVAALDPGAFVRSGSHAPAERSPALAFRSRAPPR